MPDPIMGFLLRVLHLSCVDFPVDSRGGKRVVESIWRAVCRLPAESEKTHSLRLLIGFPFVVGGVWRLLNVQLGLLPILCIVTGVALLVSTLVGGREINRAGRIGPCLKYQRRNYET